MLRWRRRWTYDSTYVRVTHPAHKQTMTETLRTASDALDVLAGYESSSRALMEELKTSIGDLDSRRNEIWLAVEEEGKRRSNEILLEMEMGLAGAKDELIRSLTRDLHHMTEKVSQPRPALIPGGSQPIHSGGAYPDHSRKLRRSLEPAHAEPC